MVLFVYGTLMRGESGHELYCVPCEYLGEAWLPGVIYQLPGGYPGLVLSPEQIFADAPGDLQDQIEHCRCVSDGVAVASDTPRVYGELIRLLDPASQIGAIDDYEDVHADRRGEYRRVLVALSFGNTSVMAWTYCLNRVPLGVPIVSGRWSRDIVKERC